MSEKSDYAQKAEFAREYVSRRFAMSDPGLPAVSAMIDLSESAVIRALTNGEKLPVLPSAPRAAELPPGPDDPLDPIELLRREISLPTLPNVFEEMNRALADDKASAKDIADIISRDASLSGQLLRLVNSAFYSFPSQIDTITRAVAIVGRKQLGALALGASVMTLFPDVSADYLDMASFWRHSVAAGVLARGLAERIGYEEPERIFVAGLLHDVGGLALVSSMPEKSAAAVKTAREQGLLLYEGERAVFGFDHARLGGIMLRKWNLPYALVNAVLHHHDPERAKSILEPALTHTADVLACSVLHCPYGEPMVPPLNAAAWDSLGLTADDMFRAVKKHLPKIEESWQALKA